MYRIIFQMLFWLGCRVGELLALTSENLSDYGQGNRDAIQKGSWMVMRMVREFYNGYRWRKEGDFTSIPRALSTSGNFANYNTMISDRFVEDGTFLRLNYLQISYNMPQKMVKKIGLSGLRFYLSGNNLFCLTKYSGVDPELGYGGYSVTQDAAQTPRAKSYTFGVTVDF